MQERRGVLVAALQSEREEKTRDRAERGSVVRGFDQASVAAKRIPRLDPYRDANEARRLEPRLDVKIGAHGFLRINAFGEIDANEPVHE